VQEAELLALKQAWERIVRRDFGRAITSSSPAAPALTHASPAPSPSTSASNLDGGVASSLGRLLALAPPPSPAPSPSLAARPSPFSRRAPAQTHTPSASASTTASTALSSASASARLSQSSASSVEPDITEEPSQADENKHARVLRRRSREAPKDRDDSVPVPDVARRVLPPPAGAPGLGSLAAMGLNANVAAAAEDWLGKRFTEGGKT
jgi:hypothetical protein